MSLQEEQKRSGSTRGAWALPEDVIKKTTLLFTELLGEELEQPPAAHPHAKQASDTLTPTAFVLAAGARHCQAEKAHLPCARAQLSGSRLVVTTSEDDLYQFYLTRNVGVGKPTFAELWRYLLLMDSKAVQDFCKAGFALLYYTLTEGDVLLLPAGWVTVEDIRGNAAVTGFKQSFLLKRDARGKKTLQNIKTHLDACTPSGTSMASAVIGALLVCG